MKPIFTEEKKFIENALNIKLPNYCWRSGSFIHLNSDLKEYIVRFKVEDGDVKLIKNKIISINEDDVTIQFNKGQQQTLKIQTWEQEYQNHKDEIEERERESLDKTKLYLTEHKDYEIRLGDSGGKDSLLTKHISLRVFKELNIDDYVVDFFNTTNETAETYKMIKQHNPKDKLIIQNPDMGWYKWLRDVKNYYIPSVMSRTCCDKYKHGRLSEIMDKNKKYVMLLGMRKYESSKRASYDWDLNEAMKDKHTVNDNWKRFLPIVNWTDEEVWLYILHNKLDFNPMYEKGFNRVGCMICPYQSDYIDLLIRKYYPKQWSRWEEMLEKNYEDYGVAKRLKWTIEEWKNGKWKQGTSKEQELITKKPTLERIKEISEIKGISEELAEKYFKRECGVCNKKLNADEIAMNLKVYGRNIDVLKMECKKCFCDSNNIQGKEYVNMVREFRDGDCNLF